MANLKCKKCGEVFEYTYKPLASFVHMGPVNKSNAQHAEKAVGKTPIHQ